LARHRRSRTTRWRRGGTATVTISGRCCNIVWAAEAAADDRCFAVLSCSAYGVRTAHMHVYIGPGEGKL
jgi:hypothetical protein